MSVCPEQKRLNETVPKPTVYAADNPLLMPDQWKVASNYITTPPTSTPTEFVPGQTAGGWRRKEQLDMTYGSSVAGGKPCYWPPTITPSHNFAIASYPVPEYAGAHLTRRIIVAGQGGIDPRES